MSVVPLRAMHRTMRPLECDDEDDVDKVWEIAVGDFLDALCKIIDMYAHI
jgi:hypothetical protein